MIDIRSTAGMREATRLTRNRKLNEAVATIQRTLQGVPVPKSPQEPHRAATLALNSENPGRADAHEPRRRSFIHRAGRMAPGGKWPTPPFGAGLQQQLHGINSLAPWREPASDPIADITPDTGRFITGTYSNQAGTRTYKLYIPSAYHGQPLPLVVMLHGCTQTPDDFAAGTRMNFLAEEHPCFVAYPAQPHTANGSKCWNWFEEAHQQRDRGEPSIIAGLTRRIMGMYRVDERRIYVAGLSAGGAMAVTMAITYPDLYAAVGIHSGLAYAVAQDLPSALRAMHGGLKGSPSESATTGSTPFAAIVFHGDRDTTVHPCNGDQVIAQCAPSHERRSAPFQDGRAPGVSVARGRVPNGHAYTRTTYHGAHGQPVMEHWLVHGAGHAWSGGSAHGSYTDPQGPDASQEMLRFFFDHPQGVIV
jgi:poly(hydroxyalkanoate) depolymerase family esterase